jgi:hypothetical protein
VRIGASSQQSEIETTVENLDAEEMQPMPMNK